SRPASRISSITMDSLDEVASATFTPCSFKNEQFFHTRFFWKLTSAGPLPEQSHHFPFISVIRKVLSIDMKENLFCLHVVDAETEIIGMLHIRNPMLSGHFHPALCQKRLGIKNHTVHIKNNCLHH